MPDLEITDRNGQKRTATDLQDKLKALKTGFFPNLRDTDLSNIAGSTYPEPIPMDREILEQEVYNAL